MGLRDRIATERNGTATSTGDDGVSYYRRRLLEEVDLSEFATLSDPQRRARLERVVGRMVSREGPVLTTAERTRLIRRVIDEAIGLGVLEPLLSDPTVTEIMVNGIDEIFVEREGRIQRADISFSDEAQLYQTIDRIVSQVNRRVDESSPMVDARLPERGARQRDHPAARAARADDHDPPLPAPVHARAARGARVGGPARPSCCCGRSSARSSTS